MAKAIYEFVVEDDPESAASMSTALVMAGAVIEREAQMADLMAACLAGSIKDGELREDEALALLSAWKGNREEVANDG